MKARQLMDDGIALLLRRPELATVTNLCNLRIAARLAWEQEEMGGLGHVQFSYRNGTPIVPPGHCCHPTELCRRGFVDGVGWPKASNSKLPEGVVISSYPMGKHFYVTYHGQPRAFDGVKRWNSYQAAYSAVVDNIVERRVVCQKAV